MPHPNTGLSVEERFWLKVDRRAPDECWEWQGARTAPGWHGAIRRSGRKAVAHRVSWELAFGPIPDGLKVCHRCDNPPCVNPMHLFLGTQQVNMSDAGRKGRLGTGRYRTHCKRGHAFEGNTYIHPVTGRRSCHECIVLRNGWRRRDAADRLAEALR